MAPESLDAVFTDPPYFGNVQYGELMDFCYVWLRRLVGNEAAGFDRASTRSSDELTGNRHGGSWFGAFRGGAVRGLFAHGRCLEIGRAAGVHLSSQQVGCVLRRRDGDSGRGLGLHRLVSLSRRKWVAPSIFTAPRRRLSDTVFVCRASEPAEAGWRVDSLEQLTAIVSDDLAALAATGRQATLGDTRCIVFGHLTRLAVKQLRRGWNRVLPDTREDCRACRRGSRFRGC